MANGLDKILNKTVKEERLLTKLHDAAQAYLSFAVNEPVEYGKEILPTVRRSARAARRAMDCSEVRRIQLRKLHTDAEGRRAAA